MCSSCEEEVQRKAGEEGGEHASELDSYVGSLSARGERLAPAAREFFEPRFGVDLSAVRVHRDTEADRSARSVDALAYTAGEHIVFRADRYDPSSDQGRHLLAHELTHVVQQSGAVSPKHVQRAPILAGQQWTVNHRDVAGRDEETQINVAVNELGMDDTQAAFYGSTLQARPNWAAKKALYVRALDFLRDNRGRFDVPDLRATLARVLDYCDASPAGVATLNDAFYTGLLLRAIYSAGPDDATFMHHTLGGEYTVPGRPRDATDFAPSGDNALLRPNLVRLPGKPSGGFPAGTDLLVAYGARPGGIPRGAAAELIERAGHRIPSKLRPYLEKLAADGTIGVVLERFLVEDGGRFRLQPVEFGGAHYTDSLPPSIEVDPEVFPGSGGEREGTELWLRVTLAHELYHYALDRADTAISEIGQGADHQIIQLVEDRYRIVESLRSGRSPVREDIGALKGWGGADLQPVLNDLIARNQPAALRTYVRSQAFLDSTVFTMLIDPVGSNEHTMSGRNGAHSTGFLLDPSQMTDLAYLAAVNGVLLRRGFEIAADVAEQKKRPLSSVWGDAAYLHRIDIAIADLITRASHNRTEGAAALASQH